MLCHRTIAAAVAFVLGVTLGACQAAAPSVTPIQTSTAPSPTPEGTRKPASSSSAVPPSTTQAISTTASVPVAPTLDGIYETSFTWEDLAASPFLVSGEIDEENWGDWQLTFAHGRFSGTQGNEFASSSSSGTFDVAGDSVILRSD